MADKPVVFDDDNPEWTESDFARARAGADVLPSALVAALVKNKGGRPRGSDKAQVSLRIDRDVLERFRAAGPGWQTRMNSELRRAAGPSSVVPNLAAYVGAQGQGARRAFIRA